MITGEDGRIQGFQEKPEPAEALSDLANCGIYMFRSEIFDSLPRARDAARRPADDDPPGFADWAMDVFPALLEADVPFYSHEIDAYWNDIGNLDELRQGNLDALTGEVAVEPGAPEVADGVRSAEPARRGRGRGPGPDRRRGRARRGRPDRRPGDRRRRLPDRRRRLSSATRSCSRAPSCRRGRWWSAASTVASPKP